MRKRLNPSNPKDYPSIQAIKITHRKAIEMKFIQLNIWDGCLMLYAIKFLKEENADIVNLQEVSAGVTATDSLYFSAYDRLRKALKYKYDFYSPMAKGEFAGHHVSRGQLILSKYPITYRKVIYTHGKLIRRSTFSSDDLNVRLLQHAKINVKGRTLNILNYHGLFIWHTKLGNKETESHSKKILKCMDSIDQNEQIILSGDFNLSPKSNSLKMISRCYTNLISKYRISTTRNELSAIKDPVDNIFVNKQVKIKSLKVPMVYISDHLPLVMDFGHY